MILNMRGLEDAALRAFWASCSCLRPARSSLHCISGLSFRDAEYVGSLVQAWSCLRPARSSLQHAFASVVSECDS